MIIILIISIMLGLAKLVVYLDFKANYDKCVWCGEKDWCHVAPDIIRDWCDIAVCDHYTQNPYYQSIKPSSYLHILDPYNHSKHNKVKH